MAAVLQGRRGRQTDYLSFSLVLSITVSLFFYNSLFLSPLISLIALLSFLLSCLSFFLCVSDILYGEGQTTTWKPALQVPYLSSLSFLSLSSLPLLFSNLPYREKEAYYGDQGSVSDLRRFLELKGLSGKLDFIIDDGSHHPDHQAALALISQLFHLSFLIYFIKRSPGNFVLISV